MLSQPLLRRVLAVVGVAGAFVGVAAGSFYAGRSMRPNPPPAVPLDAPPLAAPSAAAPAALASFSPTVFAPLGVGAQTARVPVIMYHDIIEKRGRGSVYFDCTRDEFVKQMDWLSEQGAQPISLEALHKHLTRGEPVPEKAIVLTFDDNYQGFYDIAYPILRERNFPGAVFVHTNFVGDKSGAHPKMDWDTLRTLDKEGLVTIGSHTLSHPDDMAQLPLDQQNKELVESKAILERELGRAVPYFAYPNGKGDETTFEAARAAGYTMAFTIANGPAEESPSVLSVHRYIHTRLEKAWAQCQSALANAPAAVFEQPLTPGPVRLEVAEHDGIKLGLVRGGLPTTRRAENGVRQSVGEFVQQAGAQAGMNGTFFADAALRGTSNGLIGPSRTAAEGVFFPEEAAYRLPKLLNRPLVLLGPTRLAIVPFHRGAMNNEADLLSFMPDLSDVFLAGAWIVHDGVARTASAMRPYAASDFNDPRRRAFFGVDADGQVVLGGSLEVITTERLAQAAAAAGVQEAVLLDSGFSTSIVYDNKIIVTGHTATNLPSRPVPHALVVSGTLVPPADEPTRRALERADPAVGEISAAEAQAAAPRPSERRARRRR